MVTIHQCVHYVLSNLEHMLLLYTGQKHTFQCEDNHTIDDFFKATF